MSTLQVALAVSVVAHAALLAVRFVDTQRFDRLFQDAPLEVTLVNARSPERPDKARAIAQTNLAGGGDAAAGRATSPLPPSALLATGDADSDAVRQVEALQAQQMLLLTQARQALARLAPADPKLAADHPENQAREQRRREMSTLLAQIERRIQAENERPKKRFISPSTREEAYAVYYDALRRRIEEIGTRNFPQLAGQKLYGELTVLLTVQHDGQVVSAEVVEGSGQVALDRRAVSIAREASPYGRFSEAMRQRADQIVVVSRFRFTRSDALETSLGDRP